MRPLTIIFYTFIFIQPSIFLWCSSCCLARSASLLVILQIIIKRLNLLLLLFQQLSTKYLIMCFYFTRLFYHKGRILVLKIFYFILLKISFQSVKFDMILSFNFRVYRLILLWSRSWKLISNHKIGLSIRFENVMHLFVLLTYWKVILILWIFK